MERGAQQTTVDGFLHNDRVRIPKLGGTSYFQADVGMNPETVTPQVAARQEYMKLPMSRQQRVTAPIEKNKRFDPGG